MGKSTALAEERALKKQTSWSTDENLVLVEIVLRHTREGSTMGKAWIEASDTLKRGIFGCQTHWAQFLSKKYNDAFEHAKKQRKTGKMITKKKEEENMPEIVLPKNRPISETTNQVASTQKEPSVIRAEAAVKEAKNLMEPVQQQMDFENDQIIDNTIEDVKGNPFALIRGFVEQMEEEYGDVSLLKKQLRQSEERLIGVQFKLHEAYGEIENLRNDLTKKEEEIQGYDEIKSLIQQFNQLK